MQRKRLWAVILIAAVAAAILIFAVIKRHRTPAPVAATPIVAGSVMTSATFEPYTIAPAMPPIPAHVKPLHRILHLCRVHHKMFLEDRYRHLYDIGRDSHNNLYPAYRDMATHTLLPLYYDSQRDRYYRVAAEEDGHYDRGYVGDPDNVWYRTTDEYANFVNTAPPSDYRPIICTDYDPAYDYDRADPDWHSFYHAGPGWDNEDWHGPFVAGNGSRYSDYNYYGGPQVAVDSDESWLSAVPVLVGAFLLLQSHRHHNVYWGPHRTDTVIVAQYPAYHGHTFEAGHPVSYILNHHSLHGAGFQVIAQSQGPGRVLQQPIWQPGRGPHHVVRPAFRGISAGLAGAAIAVHQRNAAAGTGYGQSNEAGTRRAAFGVSAGRERMIETRHESALTRPAFDNQASHPDTSAHFGPDNGAQHDFETAPNAPAAGFTHPEDRTPAAAPHAFRGAETRRSDDGSPGGQPSGGLPSQGRHEFRGSEGGSGSRTFGGAGAPGAHAFRGTQSNEHSFRGAFGAQTGHSFGGAQSNGDRPFRGTTGDTGGAFGGDHPFRGAAGSFSGGGADQSSDRQFRGGASGSGLRSFDGAQERGDGEGSFRGSRDRGAGQETFAGGRGSGQAGNRKSRDSGDRARGQNGGGGNHRFGDNR